MWVETHVVDAIMSIQFNRNDELRRRSKPRTNPQIKLGKQSQITAARFLKTTSARHTASEATRRGIAGIERLQTCVSSRSSSNE